MKTRLFIEVEWDNEGLLKQFGEKLPEITATHALDVRLAQTAGQVLSSVPCIKDLQVNVLPPALKSDLL